MLLSWRDKKVTYTAVAKIEKDKVTKKKRVKLSLSTIASPCKMWYHESIQVDSAYSTK